MKRRLRMKLLEISQIITVKNYTWGW